MYGFCAQATSQPSITIDQAAIMGNVRKVGLQALRTDDNAKTAIPIGIGGQNNSYRHARCRGLQVTLHQCQARAEQESANFPAWPGHPEKVKQMPGDAAVNSLPVTCSIALSKRYQDRRISNFVQCRADAKKVFHDD
jgi:hypothetical protein